MALTMYFRSHVFLALLGSTHFMVGSPAQAASDQPVSVEQPQVNDDQLELTLVTAEPDIVTPVGIAVDATGRVLAVESNTHFRPADYRGPTTDRILTFADKDGDGRFETRGVFATGLKYAMNLSIANDGSVFVVERSQITRLRDKNNDGVSDERAVLVRLVTKANYPHNGLDSFCLTQDGHAFIGTGENLGKAYSLHGSDGRVFNANGDGGQIFRVRLDGSELQQWATGFWNAFAQTTLADGSLLSIDNDPETRPPNRLLHVVRGGDYGFQYRYGRAAEHPFVAWNGELPGTLPRVGGVGEGATGILATSATGFPASFSSSVLVSSWSDRRIELHKLTPRGASFSSQMRVLVQGGRAFRPVAMAAAPDGSVFFTDWVVRDYSVHGHGRIWRLKARNQKNGQPVVHPAGPAPTAARTQLLQLENTPAAATVALASRSPDPFLRTAAARALGTAAAELQSDRDARARLTGLQALRLAFRTAVHTGAPAEAISASLQALRTALHAGLGDKDENVRIFSIITAAEGLRDDLKLDASEIERLHGAVKTASPTGRIARIYRAALAMLNLSPVAAMVLPGLQSDRATLLSRKPVQERRDALWRLAIAPDEPLLVAASNIALSTREPAILRADAVAVLANNNRVANLVGLLDDRDRTLQVEAVRALRAGLGEAVVEAAVRKKLVAVGKGRDAGLREEVRFALSDDGVAAEARPTDLASWWQAISKGGDPEAVGASS
jgi:putative membrane-bound dehydrogenase-like protein